MIRNIQRFSQSQYDLLVVGGGINGAAIAHLAARQGLRVALLEKGDFASGTSSKSTKLVHGGIRYLEHLEFDLVREALQERHIQLKVAPHLVKPVAFVIPVYKGDQRPLWMMKLGVWLYDALSGRSKIERHKTLSVADVLEHIPDLERKGLLGGVLYYDAQMDDARLCLENVLSADAVGAHVANYVEVRSFLKKNGKVFGVQAQDLIDGKSFEVRAQRIVCAVGPWSDEFLRKDNPQAARRIRPTKGIHIVYKRKIADEALLITSRQDRRIFFIIPWMGQSLIGTTDTDYNGSLEDVRADEADIEYLLKESQRVLPGVSFTREDIIMTFAGLRPLVTRKDHGSRQGMPSEISRKHVIEETDSGIVFVMGGKYTTYRKIAQECVAKLGPIRDRGFSLYGSGEILEDAVSIGRQFGVDEDVVQVLRGIYGTRYRDVLALTRQRKDLKDRFDPEEPFIKAQIVYALRVEMAQKPEDILLRRLPLAYHEHATGRYAEAVQRIIHECRLNEK